MPAEIRQLIKQIIKILYIGSDQGAAIILSHATAVEDTTDKNHTKLFADLFALNDLNLGQIHACGTCFMR